MSKWLIFIEKAWEFLENPWVEFFVKLVALLQAAEWVCKKSRLVKGDWKSMQEITEKVSWIWNKNTVFTVSLIFGCSFCVLFALQESLSQFFSKSRK